MSLEEAPSYEEEESPRDKLISIEAEQMVLGCILMNNEAFHTIDGDLSAEDFGEDFHARVYARIEKVMGEGGGATPLALANHFANDPAMNDVGNGYFANLASHAPSPRLVLDYAKLVRGLGVQRALFDKGNEIVRAALHPDPDKEPQAVVEGFQADLDGLLSKDSKRGSVSFDMASQEALSDIERAFERKGTSGILTGLKCLDRHMGGFEPTDLIVIAGRPGMGKTALATNIAVKMAKPVEMGGQGKRGLFYSMEMGASQLATRILSGETGLSTQLLRMGKFNDTQYRAFKDARYAMRSLPLEIDERGGLTIAQVASKARRVKRKQGLDFIVIDYIQLMRGKGDNRVQDITIITEGLKALAKELKVPVIALSQLSRAVESRAVKRPLLSDLRESGSIEQDADVILFPYRPEYYLRLEGKTEDDSDTLREVAGTAELILAKWRHGPVGDFDVQFDAKTTTFRDGGNDG